MTPAIASDPYCAAAPSVSTSIRAMAAVGIALRSTPCEPIETEPATLTIDVGWKRLPLTRTSTWSGLRPRSVAIRTIDVRLPPACAGMLYDGRTFDSSSCSPCLPVCCSVSALSTWIGATLSATVRFDWRVPVTMTESSCPGVVASGGLDGSAVDCAAAWPPTASAREAVLQRTVLRMGLSLWKTAGADGFRRAPGFVTHPCQHCWECGRRCRMPIRRAPITSR